MKDCREITCEYYSKWLGQDGILCHEFSGIQYLYSNQRNTVQHGYGNRFDIYALCRKNRAVISYGDAAADRLGAMKDAIGGAMTAKEIGQNLERIFHCKASYGIKYVFETMPVVCSEARVLAEADYKKYEAFFQNSYPGQNTEWLSEYFYEMVRDCMCVGVFADGRLVSCTDTPEMPYMAGDVQEIGINTLREYRGRGYASAACSKCIQEILNHHKIPMWSTEIGNIASRKLAEKIGFAEFAEVIYITF